MFNVQGSTLETEKEKTSSIKEDKGIPSDWVIYKPDELPYENLCICTCLSELRDLSDEATEKEQEKEDE